MYLTQLFWLYENVVFDLLLRLWRIRLPCCGKGFGVGRVVCFGRLLGLVQNGFLELVRGFCGDWNRECAEWVEKA